MAEDPKSESTQKRDPTKRLGSWFQPKKKDGETPPAAIPTKPEVPVTKGPDPILRVAPPQAKPVPATPPPAPAPTAAPAEVAKKPPSFPVPATPPPTAKPPEVSPETPRGSQIPPFLQPKPRATPQEVAPKIEKAPEKPVDKPAEKPIEKPTIKVVEKPVEKPVEAKPEPKLKPAVLPTNPLPKKEDDKKAQPLLSRQKYETEEAPLEAPVVPPVKGPRPLWLRIVFFIMTLVSVAGLGYCSYLLLRETRLEGKVSVRTHRLPRQISIVRDFSADIRTLREEYVMARTPIVDRIREKEQIVKRSKSDVQTVEDRLKLLEQEYASVQQETDKTIEDGKLYQQKVWEKEGALLDREFEAKLTEFEKAIRDRAQPLGLKYEPGEIRSPEVWVNAFRLSLYDVPKKMKTGPEREWAEKQLMLWRDFEKGWEDRKLKIKDQIDDFQVKTNEKVNMLRDRTLLLEEKINEAKGELQPLKVEFASAETAWNEVRASEVRLRENYYKQILETPSKNVLYEINLHPSGTFSWRYIHQNKAFPQGRYLLWLQTEKGEDVYWTAVTIELIDFHKSEIEISESAFVPINDYLK